MKVERFHDATIANNQGKLQSTLAQHGFAPDEANPGQIRPLRYEEMSPTQHAVSDLKSAQQEQAEASGEYDLKGFPRRLQQMPEEERTSLFGEQHEPLLKLSEKQQDIEPYRKAAYDTAPETLVKGVGDRTGTAFRDLAPRIGPEGVGAMQRAELERMLGSNKAGEFNLPTFGRQRTSSRTTIMERYSGKAQEAPAGCMIWPPPRTP